MLNSLCSDSVESIKKILYFLYENDGVRFSVRKKGGDFLSRISLTDHQLPVSSNDLKALLPGLYAQKIVTLRGHLNHDGSGQVWCRLSSKGLTQLQVINEKFLETASGLDSDKWIMTVESVTDRHQQISLSYSQPKDFWHVHELTITGKLNPEQEGCVEIGRARIMILDVMSAMKLEGFELEALFRSRPNTMRYLNTLNNHNEDGEAALYVFELAEMLSLEDSTLDHIYIVDDLRLSPGLIGRRLGRTVLRRLLLRFGKGGGILMLPINPTGQDEGKHVFDFFSHRLRKHYEELGMRSHPFVPGIMVGDIAKVSMANLSRKKRSNLP